MLYPPTQAKHNETRPAQVAFNRVVGFAREEDWKRYQDNVAAAAECLKISRQVDVEIQAVLDAIDAIGKGDYEDPHALLVCTRLPRVNVSE